MVARVANQVELEALLEVPVFPACFANSRHPACFHLILVGVGCVWFPAEKRGDGETSFESLSLKLNGETFFENLRNDGRRLIKSIISLIWQQDGKVA